MNYYHPLGLPSDTPLKIPQEFDLLKQRICPGLADGAIYINFLAKYWQNTKCSNSEWLQLFKKTKSLVVYLMWMV